MNVAAAIDQYQSQGDGGPNSADLGEPGRHTPKAPLYRFDGFGMPVRPPFRSALVEHAYCLATASTNCGAINEGTSGLESINLLASRKSACSLAVLKKGPSGAVPNSRTLSANE